VKNFLAPQFTVNLEGKSFNVDKTLVLPAPGTAPKTAALFPFAAPAYADAPKGADVNPLLAMAKNPVVLGAAGTVSAQIGRVTVYDAALDQVAAHAGLRNLVLKLDDASLRTFGGAVKTSGEFDLKTPGLNYHSVGTVTGISGKDAFATYFPKYKNTLEGTVDASWNVGGLAFPAATRLRNVKGTAKLVAHDGALKTVDVQDAINGALGKVSFLKGKQVKLDDGFKTLSADVRIENGVVRAEPISVEPRGRGVVLKGKSTIQESLEQDTYLDVFDPQNVLPRELHAGSKPVLPLHLTGPLSSPRFDYGYTLQRVATTAGTNVLKDQALKALGVPSTPGMSDQDKLKKAAEELKKRFHF
jgi:hypothetical protein